MALIDHPETMVLVVRRAAILYIDDGLFFFEIQLGL
jgi:hypothetical protein